MAHRLSGAAQEKLLALEEVRHKWARIHRLVEELAVQKSGFEVFWSQLRRLTRELELMLANRGLEALADRARELAGVMRRPTPARSKIRRMREVVGKARDSIEVTENEIVTDDRRRAEARKRRAAETRDDDVSDDELPQRR